MLVISAPTVGRMSFKTLRFLALAAISLPVKNIEHHHLKIHFGNQSAENSAKART